MKNIILLVILTLSAFAASCAGEITGNVYLDKNGDGLHDAGEPGLGKVLYKVTVDGNPYKTGITGDNGDIVIPKMDNGEHTYNIIVQTTAADYLENEPSISSKASTAQMPATKVMSKSMAKGASTVGGACSDVSECPTGVECIAGICGGAKKRIGETCATGYDCQTDLVCDTTTNTCAEKTDGETQTTGGGTIVTYSGGDNPSAQVKIKGYSTKARFDIGIVVDPRKNFVARVPEVPTKLTVGANEEFELIVYYPRSTKLLPLQLPAIIHAANEKFSPSTNVFDISLLKPNTSEAIRPISLTEDVLYKLALRLKAADVTKDEVVYIKPQAISTLDGSTFELGSYAITVKRAIAHNVDFKQSDSGEAKLGQNLTITSVITDADSSAFNENLLFEITLPSELTPQSFESCTKLGNNIQCDIKKGSKSPVEFELVVKLPPASVVDNFLEAKIISTLTFLTSSGEPKVKEFKIPAYNEPKTE